MITLKEHNVKPYAQLCEMLAVHQKCAYIAATGTGKSYVVGKYIEDHDLVDETLVLVPSTAIQDNWRKLLPGINVITYQALSTGNYILENVKLIVCDEMHHLGARKWGRIYKKITEGFTGKLVGTTATPIRFLDKSRNMIEEYFDNTAVEGLDLPGAISAGILPSFDYITALFNLPSRIPDEDIWNETTEKLFRRLDLMRSEYSFQNILKKHLEMSNHKVAVFVDRIKNIDDVKQLCEKVYPEASHHVIHSYLSDTAVRKAVAAFEETAGQAFIYTVDMFNEGIHIKGVDTVIMFRKTESPNIYLQQIGRALSTDMAGSRIKIFDFVANHKNLKSVIGGSATVIAWISERIESSERQIVVRDYAMEELEVLEILKDVLNGAWTEEEDCLIAEKYNLGKGVAELVKLLPRRTRASIMQRASKLGVNRKNNYAERGVYEAIKKLYLAEGGTEKLQNMFPDIPNSTLVCIANRMGIRRRQPYKEWTNEEDKLIRSLLDEGASAREVGEKINRTSQAVFYRKKKNGSIEDEHVWTEEEDQILRDNSLYSDRTIQLRFFHTISRQAIRERRIALGISIEEVWTNEVVETFKSIYATDGYMGIQKNELFSRMTSREIKGKARELGVLSKNNRAAKRWSAADKAALSEYIAAAGVSKKAMRAVVHRFPERTIDALLRMAGKLAKEAEANGTDTKNTGAAVPTDTKAEA